MCVCMRTIIYIYMCVYKCVCDIMIYIYIPLYTTWPRGVIAGDFLASHICLPESPHFFTWL